MASTRWLPLESNPEVMNKYINNLGVESKEWKYFDVYGLDPELLMLIPRPVSALLLLFPVTENYRTFCEEEGKRLENENQVVSEEVYFTKQTVGNACGTVAIIHSISNNNLIKLKDGAPLKSFLESTKSMTPQERAVALEKDEGITRCHGDSAVEGQTQAVDEEVALHFVAIVHKDGHIYELDGRKPFPINHGTTSVDSFVDDAAVVCKKYMERDPTLLQFSIVALAKED